MAVCSKVGVRASQQQSKLPRINRADATRIYHGHRQRPTNASNRLKTIHAPTVSTATVYSQSRKSVCAQRTHCTICDDAIDASPEHDSAISRRKTQTAGHSWPAVNRELSQEANASNGSAVTCPPSSVLTETEPDSVMYSTSAPSSTSPVSESLNRTLLCDAPCASMSTVELSV
jgi:hypothetical protein